MKRRSILAGFCAAAAVLPAANALAAAAPVCRKPARVILVTGGSYSRYRQVFISILSGLKMLRLIDWAPSAMQAQSEPAGEDERAGTADIWAALASRAGGTCLQFLPDGHYDYDFNPATQSRLLKALENRFATKRDVDMVLCFGTEPTRDMARVAPGIPVLSLGSTDPVGTGLVKSIDDSGQDNLHVLVVEDYFERQVRAFHAVYPFRCLGFFIAKERFQKSGEKSIRRASELLGIEYAFESYEETGDAKVDFERVKGCLEKLAARGADAVMVPWFYADAETLARLSDWLCRHGIASFSQAGPEYVARGLLLGSGVEDFASLGVFEANVIRRVVERERPRSIPQAYRQGGHLVVNLTTAMRLGWQPPFGLLVSAEKAYTSLGVEREKE